MDMLGSGAASIQSFLDLAADRHRVIQENLANINTPGYRAKNVSFDQQLGRAMVTEREGINPRQDGNTVVPEIENAELRKNQLVYRLFLQAMTHRTRMARSAIAGRGQ